MKTPSSSPLPSPSSVSPCLTPPPPPPPADDDSAEPAIAGIPRPHDGHDDARRPDGARPDGARPGSTAPPARPGPVLDGPGGDGGAVAEKGCCWPGPATAPATPPALTQPETKNKAEKAAEKAKAAEAEQAKTAEQAKAAEKTKTADAGPDGGLFLRVHGLDGLGFYGSHDSSQPAAGTVEDAVDAGGEKHGPDGPDGPDGPSRRTRLAALAVSFAVTARRVLLRTWLNAFLVFVPAGIAVAALPSCPPAVVFSLNAIAIVPLAGLLSFATEAVAHQMGDSVGALLNVTFGNAVELIIFIALVKDEIRIVQASLLGSILANLLLILGMGFLLGGLRFREQIYNSTVTQMSACLLSLSVISLVLPTAFHASFSDNKLADSQSLKISRGTSVVLLLVYGIYLLFQLKSHAYMYESTPQHIIDEEATPGPAAAWLDTSSTTSDDSAASSDSDSDASGHSRDTMRQRMRRVMRRRHRKSSVASLDTAESVLGPGLPTRTPSSGAATAVNDELPPPTPTPGLADEVAPPPPQRHHSKRALRHHHRRRHRRRSNASSSIHASHVDAASVDSTIVEGRETDAPRVPETTTMPTGETTTATPAVASGETRRVDFALVGSGSADAAVARRTPLHLRAMALRPVAKSLAPSVFTQQAGAQATAATAATGPIPRVRYGIRRTNSLPDRLNQQQLQAIRPPGAMLPAQIPARRLAFATSHAGDHGDGYDEGRAGGPNGHGNDTDAAAADDDDADVMLSRKAAMLVLLVTTGLVAACAEFMVDSINGLVATSPVNEVFIGLIILPIVGNAAEHVTAVTVAMKNKMDLAIGVAVGSSIQIALFMTPLVVILGWCMGRAMTLYFTLFETVCLFVSAFIVNFLVLDGRSNYLEGALLCATYVIIGLAAFFYPAEGDASTWG